MNKVLLINRVNPLDDTDERKKVFFLIGEMNTSSTEDKIKEVLDKLNFKEREEIIYKYNGIELDINTQEIPQIVKSLSEADILIYSVFEVYDPNS